MTALRGSFSPSEAGSLDLHEGIDTLDPSGTKCGRFPEPLWLLNRSTGEAVKGRCRATRKCDYCGRLGAVENAEMVALDACSYPPSLFCVLTTRDPFMPSTDVRRHLDKVAQHARSVFPDFQYARFTEFTTGLSVWSGGLRRLHLNLLVKGVPAERSGDQRDVLLST